MALTIYNGELSSYDVATKEVSGEHVQSLQIDVGENGEVSPLTKGQKTAAESLPVILASDQALPLPSGAATSEKQDSLNSKIDSVNAKLPALSGGRVPVDVGSPSVSVPVRSFSTVATNNYAVGTTAGEAVASNVSRKGGFIQNVSDSDIYLLFAATGSPTTASVKLRAGASIDFTLGEKGGVYTGAVRAINFVGAGKNLVIVQTS